MQKLAIGIDVGGTNLRGGLISQSGEMLKRLSLPSEAGAGIEAVIGNLKSVISALKSGGVDIVGAGLGVPGIIDTQSGILTQAPNISSVKNYPLRAALERELGGEFPIFIENDATAAALGEWKFGAGAGFSSLIVITLGTGVGGGMVLGGRVWRGRDGMAGEIGHTTIHRYGARCNCGNFGCLESYASANAVRRMAGEIIENHSLNTSLREYLAGAPAERIPEIVAQAARLGDNSALWIWQEVGEALGIALANIANLLNIEAAIIGGGLSNASELFIDYARAVVKRRGLSAPVARLAILKSELGDDAGIIGAGALAFGEIR
ncbi:MAG: ROK family protein [Deltaproteobacteria bacterium]